MTSVRTWRAPAPLGWTAIHVTSAQQALAELDEVLAR